MDRLSHVPAAPAPKRPKPSPTPDPTSGPDPLKVQQTGNVKQLDRKRVFVKGLPPSTTHAHLMGHFGSYGQILECLMPVDSSNRPRGFAFITFVNPEASTLPPAPTPAPTLATPTSGVCCFWTKQLKDMPCWVHQFPAWLPSCPTNLVSQSHGHPVAQSPSQPVTPFTQLLRCPVTQLRSCAVTQSPSYSVLISTSTGSHAAQTVSMLTRTRIPSSSFGGSSSGPSGAQKGPKWPRADHMEGPNPGSPRPVMVDWPMNCPAKQVGPSRGQPWRGQVPFSAFGSRCGPI